MISRRCATGREAASLTKLGRRDWANGFCMFHDEGVSMVTGGGLWLVCEGRSRRILNLTRNIVRDPSEGYVTWGLFVRTHCICTCMYLLRTAFCWKVAVIEPQRSTSRSPFGSRRSCPSIRRPSSLVFRSCHQPAGLFTRHLWLRRHSSTAFA